MRPIGKVVLRGLVLGVILERGFKMPVTEREFVEILQQGHETPGVEFKGPGPRSDKQLFAKVVRAALAMANRRDGGQIIVGVREDGDQLVADGVNAADLPTWNHDDVTGAFSAYADPYVSASVQHLPYQGKTFVIITVAEFEQLPVLCKKDYPDVLRDGSCYTRRKGRIESSEIPNHAEMRDLLELATEKGLRRFFRTASRAEFGAVASLSDRDRYQAELVSFE